MVIKREPNADSTSSDNDNGPLNVQDQAANLAPAPPDTADKHLRRKLVLIAASASVVGCIAFAFNISKGSPLLGSATASAVTLLALIGPTVTLFKDDIRRLAVPRKAVTVAVVMALLSISGVASYALFASSSDSDGPLKSVAKSMAPSTMTTALPAEQRQDGSLQIDHECGDLSPTAWALPAYQICVVNWCQGIVTNRDGTIDSGRVQIKLHPRIANNTSEPLDIAITQRPSPLRLLVASDDLPASWRPPDLTAENNDRPFLVQLQGQNYWAIAPNLPHDIDSMDGPVAGFATFWDRAQVGPNSFYPPPTQRDIAGNAIEQQGDLVFQLPARNQSNHARFAGLGLFSRSSPTTLLAFADHKDWGPRLNPNQF